MDSQPHTFDAYVDDWQRRTGRQKNIYEGRVAAILVGLGGSGTMPGSEFKLFLDKIDLITLTLPLSSDSNTLQRDPILANLIKDYSITEVAQLSDEEFAAKVA